jgi:1-acyl-sn-glycerol-3-phosphate acyltransferase
LQITIRLALRIFCRDITVSNKIALQSKGPLLLACNHPNGFLDAIIIGSLFQQPVHYLARGDAFKYLFTNKILKTLKILPIYSLSEGHNNLSLNNHTFNSCQQILLQGGIVLIFSEGISKHAWQLQPLKKSTARIAFKAWEEPIISNYFQVQPVSINYHSFTLFGKQIFIHFGKTIGKQDVISPANEGEKIQQFNALLINRLSNGILLANNDATLVSTLFTKHKHFIHSPATAIADLQYLQANHQLTISSKTNSRLQLKIILLVPAIIGFILHAALYFPVKRLVQHLTKDTVFYDSVLFGSLVILYPFYYIFINILAFSFTNILAFQIVVILMPLWLWLLTHYKRLCN